MFDDLNLFNRNKPEDAPENQEESNFSLDHSEKAEQNMHDAVSQAGEELVEDFDSAVNEESENLDNVELENAPEEDDFNFVAEDNAEMLDESEEVEDFNFEVPETEDNEEIHEEAEEVDGAFFQPNHDETALDVVAGGQLSFNEQVIEKIAHLAMREVGGVLAATSSGGFFNLKSSKGVEIEIDNAQNVTVNLEVILEYGRSAPEIFDNLKQTIGGQIQTMTGLKVKAVNVRVLNALTAEEFNGRQ